MRITMKEWQSDNGTARGVGGRGRSEGWKGEGRGREGPQGRELVHLLLVRRSYDYSHFLQLWCVTETRWRPIGDM